MMSLLDVVLKQHKCSLLLAGDFASESCFELTRTGLVLSGGFSLARSSSVLGSSGSGLGTGLIVSILPLFYRSSIGPRALEYPS